jgi:hypothetical protein
MDLRDQPLECARTAIWELGSGIADGGVRQQTVEHGQAAVAELARRVSPASAPKRTTTADAGGMNCLQGIGHPARLATVKR